MKPALLLHKWRRVSWQDHMLFGEALARIGVARLSVIASPLVGLGRRPNVRLRDGAPAARIAWAIGIASRFVPHSTCLVLALAAQRMLAYHGHASDLRIGATKTAQNDFIAHAWVECNGAVLVGRIDTHFVPFSPRSI